MEIKVGTILTMKKKHPCGGCEWEVLYAASDIKMRCKTCGREVITPRSKAVKMVKPEK